jgi:hypothetical protein
MTRRQTIVATLVTLLGTVTTANGYATDAGSVVKLNPDKESEPLGTDQTAAFVVRETGGNEMAGMAGEDVGVIELELISSATAVRSDDPDATARLARGDMVEAIGEDKTLGGLCDDFVLGEVEVESDQKGKRAATVTQKARIIYRNTRWEPSTAPA